MTDYNRLKKILNEELSEIYKEVFSDTEGEDLELFFRMRNGMTIEWLALHTEHISRTQVFKKVKQVTDFVTICEAVMKLYEK